MKAMNELIRMRAVATVLQQKNSHLSRSLDGVIDYLNDAITAQHEHDGTGKYAPTEEDLNHMAIELKMEGERE